MNKEETLGYTNSVRDKEMMMQNENYRRFAEEKKEVQSKYDKRIFSDSGVRKTKTHLEWFGKEGRWEYRKYLTEILEVMMRVDSPFRKFMEDVEPEMETKKRERNARGGRLNKTQGYSYT